MHPHSPKGMNSIRLIYYRGGLVAQTSAARAGGRLSNVRIGRAQRCNINRAHLYVRKTN
jgi:hypothetical protein